MNNITIELCTEDRARLDRLTAALENQATVKNVCTCKTGVLPEQMSIDVDALTPHTEASQKPADAQNEPTPTTTAPTEEEKPTEAKKPSVSLEQIQQKVMQLAAANGGAKKAKVRDIISTYAQKVSKLPEDKWDEVWQKLTALESES